MENTEDKIRDKLITRLDILDSDLTLIDKEDFLPNEKGTRGFIDILAKDSQNRFVIIELKRSKASSREALHEILKYIEGIKENKSLKNDEIRIIIVSTEWQELIVPFSSFVNKTSISISGYLLKIDKELNPISTELVKPLKLNNDRLLSDIHSLHLYKNFENLQKGILSHKEVLKQKKIDDYLLVVLKGDPSHKNNIPNNIFWYDFMIYKVIQVLDEEHYYNIIKKDQAQFEELESIKEDYKHEDLLSLLHTYAIDNIEPFPYHDNVEIGTPAKFAHKLLEEEKWEIQEIIRSGKFINNELLTDQILIQEISGSSGTNKQRYHKEFSADNLSSLEEISKSVSNCLVDNQIWKQGILYAIQKIKETKFNQLTKGKINIYNPSNTIFSIYKVASNLNSEEFINWIPHYTLLLEDELSVKLYVGCLFPNGKQLTLESIIDRYYMGDTFQLLLLMTWGGYEYRDVEISSFIGLEYTNFYIEFDKKTNKKNIFKFNGFQYIPIEELEIFTIFIEFINNNQKMVSEICDFYNKHLY
ncbi:endonuclease NucS domain-containing protein [Aliarcobacter butzleri]|uniref:endonuclease NucS domain-containing protein n=1 Tax=Aliarcobacter butzleri TaxID=28197 RepID=UPI003B21FD8A